MDDCFTLPSHEDPLSAEECRELLATRSLGRVGLTSGALPVILPVAYSYDDGTITFRAEPDAKLRAAAEGDVLAFEVDAFDAGSGRGWSVLVLGRAALVTPGDEATPPAGSGASSSAAAGPEIDLAGAHRPQRVRMRCELMTGRRLVSSRV